MDQALLVVKVCMGHQENLILRVTVLNSSHKCAEIQ